MALLLFGGDMLQEAAPSQGGPAIVDSVAQVATPERSNPLLSGRSGSLSVGDPAPDFLLNDFDGVPTSLADFAGRPVILNFWATWCAPCRVEMPELQATYEKYQEEDLVILALNQDEPLEIARAFFYDDMGLTFTPLLDERRVVAAQYNAVFALPTTVFVNAEGNVTAIHHGLLTANQIDDYLNVTLSGG